MEHNLALLPQYQRETYSECDMKILCNIAGAPQDSRASMKLALEDIAAIYRRTTENSAPHPSTKETNRELSSIAKRAAQLAQQIEDMSYEASLTFEQQNIEDETAHIDGVPSTASLVLSNEFQDTDTIAWTLEQGDIVNVLRGIERAAKSGIERQSPQKSGRRLNPGLDLWMSNVAAIWKDFSTLPFSRTVTDQNEPVSPAARFCAIAFERLSHQTPTSRVMLAMKDHITRHRAQER